MKKSDEVPILNLYQRIRNVMLDVKAVNKESKKVNNQYTFVSHDAVAGALHDPLANHGIVMIPTVSELTQDGNRTCAKVNFSFVNIDNPEDRLSVDFYGYGIDSSDKGVGKAISYAVKYCLLKMFCLETGDDVEKDNIDYEPPINQALSEVQIKTINDLLDTPEIKKWFTEGLPKMKVKSLEDVKSTEFTKIVERIREKKAELTDAE